MIRQFDPDFNLTRSTGAYIEELTEKRERPERIVTRNIVKITKASRFIETLAPLVYDIIERTREGRLKVELDHINLDREISKLDTAINKIAMSAIVSSLVIGSSLVLVSDKGPIVYGFPAVGIGGLVIAAFLGSIVILRILGSREV